MLFFAMRTPVLSVEELRRGFTGTFEVVAADKAGDGRRTKGPISCCSGFSAECTWTRSHIPQTAKAPSAPAGSPLIRETVWMRSRYPIIREAASARTQAVRKAREPPRTTAQAVRKAHAARKAREPVSTTAEAVRKAQPVRKAPSLSLRLSLSLA